MSVLTCVMGNTKVWHRRSTASQKGTRVFGKLQKSSGCNSKCWSDSNAFISFPKESSIWEQICLWRSFPKITGKKEMHPGVLKLCSNVFYSICVYYIIHHGIKAVCYYYYTANNIVAFNKPFFFIIIYYCTQYQISMKCNKKKSSNKEVEVFIIFFFTQVVSSWRIYRLILLSLLKIYFIISCYLCWNSGSILYIIIFLLYRVERQRERGGRACADNLHRY